MKEGFWKASNDPLVNAMPWEHDTAWPEATDVPVSEDVLRKLDVAERLAKVEEFLGWSRCRLCGIRNGSRELSLHGWTWPCGYRHYLQVHDVHPTKEFVRFLESVSRAH